MKDFTVHILQMIKTPAKIELNYTRLTMQCVHISLSAVTDIGNWQIATDILIAIMEAQSQIFSHGF